MTEQTITAASSPTPASLQEALVVLLIASARADGSVSLHEANQIEHMVAGMKLFRGVNYETRQRVFTGASERMAEHGAATVLPAAAAMVPKALAATALAVAVDLMLSDGHISASEQEFVNTLSVLLNVDSETVARIVDVLTIKNAG